MKNIVNQVFIVTGAASGMGQEIAVDLARRGARVVVVARDVARTQQAIAAVRERAEPGARVEGIACDLSSIASIKSAARELVQRHPRVHLLVNNAAVFHRERHTTRDGLEVGFAVNTLAPYLLTRLLEPSLFAAHGARVVHMTMESNVPMRFDDPQHEHGYDPLTVLRMTKAGSQYLTRVMSERYAERGVEVVCVNPGLTRSKLPSEAPLPVRLLFSMFGKDPGAGAQVPLSACLDPIRYPSGAFVNPKGRAIAYPAFIDDVAGQRVWELCASLTST